MMTWEVLAQDMCLFGVPLIVGLMIVWIWKDNSQRELYRVKMHIHVTNMERLIADVLGTQLELVQRVDNVTELTGAHIDSMKDVIADSLAGAEAIVHKLDRIQCNTEEHTEMHNRRSTD